MSTKSSLHAKGHVEKVEHGEHRITDRGLKFISGEYSKDNVMESLRARKKGTR